MSPLCCHLVDITATRNHSQWYHKFCSWDLLCTCIYKIITLFRAVKCTFIANKQWCSSSETNNILWLRQTHEMQIWFYYGWCDGLWRIKIIKEWMSISDVYEIHTYNSYMIRILWNVLKVWQTMTEHHEIYMSNLIWVFHPSCSTQWVTSVSLNLRQGQTIMDVFWMSSWQRKTWRELNPPFWYIAGEWPVFHGCFTAGRLHYYMSLWIYMLNWAGSMPCICHSRSPAEDSEI